jgi:hypothetical protein
MSASISHLHSGIWDILVRYEIRTLVIQLSLILKSSMHVALWRCVLSATASVSGRIKENMGAQEYRSGLATSLASTGRFSVTLNI